jgi:cobalt-zinc-cadmium efflux system membrane fusion protein
VNNKMLSCVRIVFAASVAVGMLAGCSPGDTGSPPSSSVVASNVTLTAAQQQNIHLAVVQSSNYNRTIDTTGTVDFDNDHSTTILAPMSGPVSKLLVSLGDQVTVEQPLAEVDSPDFATAISAYRKALATAKILRQLAEQDQDLLQHRGVSLREADQAKIDATNAQADSEADLQQLVSLKVNPDTIKAIQDGKPPPSMQGLIRSPIAGTVVDRAITPGELLQAGTTTCFTIADLSRVWVMAHVFGADVGAVSVGDSAEVWTGAGNEKLTGTVGNVGSVVDSVTRSVAVRVVTDNPGGLLKDQMYVRVQIHSKKSFPGLMAPVSAILRDDENLPFVYLTQADGSFARRRVTLGYRAADQYEISEGLAAGDRIVAEGALFMQFLQNQ